MATTPEVDWAEKWPKKFSESFVKQKNLSKLLKAPFIVASICKTCYNCLKIILKVFVSKNYLKVFNILLIKQPFINDDCKKMLMSSFLSGKTPKVLSN